MDSNKKEKQGKGKNSKSTKSPFTVVTMQGLESPRGLTDCEPGRPSHGSCRQRFTLRLALRGPARRESRLALPCCMHAGPSLAVRSKQASVMGHEHAPGGLASNQD